MKSPALIGEAPGANGHPARPLDGRPGRVLCDLAGWDAGPDAGAYLMTHFWVANVLDAYPGPNGKGTAWPLDRARERVGGLREALAQRVAAVLLGKRVAAAFGIVGPEYCAWRPADRLVPIRHVVIPHPSGINRALNDSGLRRRTGGVLREACKMDECRTKGKG